MPRVYKRKTNRGSTPLEDIERAAKEVAEGKSIRSVARAQKIDRMTLKRYMDKQEQGEVPRSGYDRVAEAQKIFNEKIESELAGHIKKLLDQFHGLSPLKCRELAFELAKRNDITVPENWCREERAGLVNGALMSAMTPSNILSGFRSTGIFPFNRNIFPDTKFEPSVVTERPNSEQPCCFTLRMKAPSQRMEKQFVSPSNLDKCHVG
ncbi:uncharacterized protein LOC117972802 [Acipenser ruthenus]|uniref:uncharacterized protein LOC117972802 n=1 Tax=Acipenser ruthenus TaxID=7906 RepID=UPI0027405C6B|nr:uncharacterized protein LOC117972802 [Acipenser ruthenus]